MPLTHPCPKCGRKLQQSGEITTETGQNFPTFQCDECLANVDFCGEKVEIALTFALDADGKPFDPAAEDGQLPI